MTKRLMILGVKEWPYGSSSSFEKNTGGGTGKNITKLISSLPNDYKHTILTRKIKNQEDFESIGNLRIHRFNFLFGRFSRVISFYLAILINSFRIVREEKIEFIICNGSISIFIGSIIGRVTGVKTIGLPRGVSQTRKKDDPFLFLPFRLMELFSFKKMDLLVFLSESERSRSRRYGIVGKCKSVVIPNGVEFRDLKINNVDKESSHFEILFVEDWFPGKI